MRYGLDLDGLDAAPTFQKEVIVPAHPGLWELFVDKGIIGLLCLLTVVACLVFAWKAE